MAYQELALPCHVKLDYSSSESVLHINARSVSCKEDEIVLLLQQFSSEFGIIMFSETWYSDDCKMLELAGYNNFFLNRKNRRGGGVAILVAKQKNCEILPAFSMSTEDFEIISVQNSKELISVLYRPPTGNVAHFLEFYETFLEYVCQSGLRLINGGDFNINLLEENTSATALQMTLLSSGFLNVIKTATRITTSRPSMLDLMITNIDTTVCNAGTVASDISDHCPVFFNIPH